MNSSVSLTKRTRSEEGQQLVTIADLHCGGLASITSIRVKNLPTEKMLQSMLWDYNILINPSQSSREREQMNKCYNSGKHLSTCDKGV